MNPFDVLDEVARRTAEAVIAQSGLAREGLRRHLRELFSAGNLAGALLQEPVLEGAPPFVTADESMAGLSGKLSHPKLADALDGLPEGLDYRFAETRRPFQPQVKASPDLTDAEPQSVLVTSGTGAGKTACSLFPVLNDLVAPASAPPGPLDGVKAIMLYPLNALIE